MLKQTQRYSTVYCKHVYFSHKNMQLLMHNVTAIVCDINSTLCRHRHNTELNTNWRRRPTTSSASCLHTATALPSLSTFFLNELPQRVAGFWHGPTYTARSLPRAGHIVIAACSVDRLHRTALLHLSANIPTCLLRQLKETDMDDVRCQKPQGSSCSTLHDEMQYRNTT